MIWVTWLISDGNLNRIILVHLIVFKCMHLGFLEKGQQLLHSESLIGKETNLINPGWTIQVSNFTETLVYNSRALTFYFMLERNRSGILNAFLFAKPYSVPIINFVIVHPSWPLACKDVFECHFLLVIDHTHQRRKLSTYISIFLKNHLFFKSL